MPLQEALPLEPTAFSDNGRSLDRYLSNCGRPTKAGILGGPDCDEPHSRVSLEGDRPENVFGRAVHHSMKIVQHVFRHKFEFATTSEDGELFLLVDPSAWGTW